MPRYFFVLHGPDDELHNDVNGTELSDKTQALTYGRQIVRELKDSGGYDKPGWVMVIINGTGEQIASVPFTDNQRFH
jgi:hypothetical protein